MADAQPSGNPATGASRTDRADHKPDDVVAAGDSGAAKIGSARDTSGPDTLAKACGQSRSAADAGPAGHKPNDSVARGAASSTKIGPARDAHASDTLVAARNPARSAIGVARSESDRQARGPTAGAEQSDPG